MARRADRPTLRESLAAYALLAPAMVVFAGFAFWPFIQLIIHSVTQTGRRTGAVRYVGTKPLTDTLTGPEFLGGLRVSGLVVVYSVPLGIVLGILMAVAVNRRLRGIRIFQTIFSSTVASSAAVSTVVFLALVNPQIGYFKSVSWLDINDAGSGLFRPALFAVSLSLVWQNLGLTFIIVLAGLQAIPKEVDEAALLDGYGAVRKFFRVTMPLLSPTLLFVVVVLSVRALQMYAPIRVITGGGPAGQTESLLYKITRLTDLSSPKGAAMSLGLFVVSLIVAAGQFAILDRRVHYGE